MTKFYNMEQGTDEWFAVRDKKMTASHAQAIGNCGKGLDSYIYELMAKHYSSAERANYTNADMERGNELEPDARTAYEFEMREIVKEVGFVEYNEYVGASPDGLIGNDGLVEIKCKSDTNHLKQMLAGEKGIESKYIWQMQMQMLVTGRQYCDFVSFNPHFEKSLLVYRVLGDENKFEKLLEGFEKGEEMIKQIELNFYNIV